MTLVLLRGNKTLASSLEMNGEKVLFLFFFLFFSLIPTRMFPDVELQSKVAEFKKTPTFVHVSDHLSLTLSSTRQTINLLQKYDFATQALFSAFHDRDTIGLVNLGFQMCLPQV